MLANKVTSPSLFGIHTNTGFSSDSEEMKTALRTLYRNQINPMRENILEALEVILSIGYPDVKLRFKDFEELMPEEENKEINKASHDARAVKRIKPEVKTKNKKTFLGDLYRKQFVAQKKAPINNNKPI
jgi:hypothetical protein